MTVAVTDVLGKTREAAATVTVFNRARAGRNVRLRGGRAQLKVFCPSPAGCAGTARLIAPVKLRRGNRLVKKRRPIGRADFTLPGPATATVPIELSGAALPSIRGAGRQGLKAQLTGPGIKHRVVALFAGRGKG